jgi:hypothetical protein
MTGDREQLAIGATENGCIVFYNPTTDHHVKMLAALRDEFDRVDPTPPQAVIDGDRFSDLRDQVRIPQLGAFAKEFLRDDGTQTDDDTTEANQARTSPNPVERTHP